MKGDFILSLLTALFKDADGKLILWRLIGIIIVCSGAFLWYARLEMFNLYKETRFDAYTQAIKSAREKNYLHAAEEQLEIVHVSSGSEFSGVIEFRPKGLNYFFDLIAYEGILPEELNSKNLGGYPIDKTTEEYNLHINGEYYVSNEIFRLPTRDQIQGKHLFSCPIFNLDNEYSGSIFMMWSEKPVYAYRRLNFICGEAARTLGRAK